MKEEIEKKMLEAIVFYKPEEDFLAYTDCAKACSEVASTLLTEKEREIAELKEEITRLEKEAEDLSPMTTIYCRKCNVYKGYIPKGDLCSSCK